MVFNKIIVQTSEPCRATITVMTNKHTFADHREEGLAVSNLVARWRSGADHPIVFDTESQKVQLDGNEKHY